MSKILLTLSLFILLCFSCQKQDLTIYHRIGYEVTKPEGVVIDTIFYKDNLGNTQIMAKPLGRIYLSMEVEEGFTAELRVKGSLQNSTICNIEVLHQKGENTERTSQIINTPGPFDETIIRVIQ